MSVEDNDFLNSPNKVALSILVVCLLALGLGVFNAVRTKAPPPSNAEELDGSVSSLFEKKGDQIMLVDLSGPITMDAPGDSSGLFDSDTNAMKALKALNKAEKEPRVKAVLLRVNSPGGTVGMSQELNAAVRRVSLKKPVVASFGDTAASGGYYTACAADKIVTNPGTLTASIGVIISTINMQRLFEDKLGLQPVTIKSGKFKDILSPYRQPTEDDKKLIQGIIDDSYADFLSTVLEGRTRFVKDPVKKAALTAKIKAIADGRVVSGRQAIAAGLADELGDLKAAYELTNKMAKERHHLSGDKQLPLVPFEEHATLLEMLGLPTLMQHLPAPRSASGADMASAEVLGGMLPFSVRYPNQPLWILE
ncbi:MAG: signal peptide peptidase SppA [Candidatus Melainabacteria bacterium]